MSLLKRFFSRLFSRGPVWDGGQGAGVLLVDREGRIEDVSDGAPALAGRPSKALIGMSLTDLFPMADRAGVARALSLAGAGAKARGRIADRFEVELFVRARADGKRAVLMLARPPASQEAEALAREAEKARREAKETADLLADLSHEMRTPLNAVIGFADAMTSETFGPLGHPKYAEYAGHIRASGGHLLDLVSAILDLAKIEADRFALKRELVDVGRVARECAAMMRLSAEKAGLALNMRIADDLPQSFLDPRAVRQILLNLLSNAVKFTSDGEITLTADAEDGEIILTVTDTGVGMSEAELAKLGARFTTAHGPGVRGAKGAGLGLALAFALAELHGGSMALSSAPGEGLTARVRLPVTAAPARRRGLEAVSAETKAPGEPPAVLTQLERIEAYRRERASAA